MGFLPLENDIVFVKRRRLSSVMFGQSQYLSSQRGPLQSSNNPSIRAWIDASSSFVAATDHRRHCLSPAVLVHQFSSSSSGAGFASGGFSGERGVGWVTGDRGEEEVMVFGRGRRGTEGKWFVALRA
ncbi:hypothetical protein SESBI_36103 [Sesbania bispinosa]|nr:hypothetical protein SESBI_36103 [Sesbania bispinosa]